LSFAAGGHRPYMQRALCRDGPALGPPRPRKVSHQMSEPTTVYANTSQLIAAEEPDFPAFLFSRKELHRATKVFRKGFDGLLTYAVKCNPSPHILKQLHEEGLKAFDVASNMEMELVRDYAPGAAMHYNNPIKNKREIERAYNEF